VDSYVGGIDSKVGDTDVADHEFVEQRLEKVSKRCEFSLVDVDLAIDAL
jgi:hypothetical protein